MVKIDEDEDLSPAACPECGEFISVTRAKSNRWNCCVVAESIFNMADEGFEPLPEGAEGVLMIVPDLERRVGPRSFRGSNRSGHRREISEGAFVPWWAAQIFMVRTAGVGRTADLSGDAPGPLLPFARAIEVVRILLTNEEAQEVFGAHVVGQQSANRPVSIVEALRHVSDTLGLRLDLGP